MAEERTRESVGYRVNATEKERENSEIQRQSFFSGQVTVYAERRNANKVLGEYGGDAYPMVYERPCKDGKSKYGVILVADGVGQGSYEHPSLQEYLNKLVKSDQQSEEQGAPEKLSVFLRTLYGNEIFAEENADVLAYALRSFSRVPADGYFVSPSERWAEKGNHQYVCAFHKRDSQSLGSRLLCVGLFLKFRDFFSDPAAVELNAANAETLRAEIEAYIDGSLKKNVGIMFRHEDAPDTDKRNRYFLPSTVAAWFYVYNAAEGEVHALALNCGDARCYIADTVDGVRQISVDDAFPDGKMSAFIHFGAQPLNKDGYHDLKLRARLVRVKAPCALIACSDGVYDTCPYETKQEILRGKYSPSYGETYEPCDYLFEVNLLEALRRCYSFDDFSREIVFNFYAQTNARTFAEFGNGGSFPEVKRDDSGTLGARFLGDTPNNPLVLFQRLRECRETTLDRLRNKLETAAKEQQIRIPYSTPHVMSNEKQEAARRGEYAKDKNFLGVSEVLKRYYHDAYESMRAAGESVLWGSEHPAPEVELKGFGLNSRFREVGVRISILMLAVEDWISYGHALTKEGFALPEEAGPLHKHVIIDEEIFDILVSIDFEKWVRALTEGVKDTVAETKLKLYKHFERCFFGELNEDPHALIGEDEALREPSGEGETYAQLLDRFAAIAMGEPKKDDAPVNAEETKPEAEQGETPAPETAEKTESVATEAAGTDETPVPEGKSAAPAEEKQSPDDKNNKKN